MKISFILFLSEMKKSNIIYLDSSKKIDIF